MELCKWIDETDCSLGKLIDRCMVGKCKDRLIRYMDNIMNDIRLLYCCIVADSFPAFFE